MNERLRLLLESLRKLLRRNSLPRVSKLLAKSRCEDIASVMRYLDHSQRQQVFDLLPSDEVRAETLAEIDEHIFVEIVEGRSIEQVAKIIDYMSVDDQANFLAELPEDLKEKILELH